MLYFPSYPSSSLPSMTSFKTSWAELGNALPLSPGPDHSQTPSSAHVIQYRIRVRPGYLIKRVRPTWPRQNVTRMTRMTRPGFSPAYSCRIYTPVLLADHLLLWSLIILVAQWINQQIEMLDWLSVKMYLSAIYYLNIYIYLSTIDVKYIYQQLINIIIEMLKTDCLLQHIY